MKIAIVGAGVAGLSALRLSLEQNHECLCFEQTGNVGGTWNYTDAVDLDEYGLPVRSSMYQGLVTNLPKELMEFEDYHYEEKDRSFIPQVDVLEYINTFADHFKLRQHIKFFKHVVEVDVAENNKWKVTVKDLKSGEVEELNFDAVMICIGNFGVPKSLDVFPGLEHFEGHFIHSHLYRKPDKYKGKVVLVIGGGPSGVDISRILQGTAQTVFLSSGEEPILPLKENVISKSRVTSFEKGLANFEDGTSEVIEEIIFCTGYCYSFPFLTQTCGITVQNNCVKPLYKHILNIQHPTMAFIGIPFTVCPFLIVGHQVKFALAFLQKKIHKSKEEMLDDLDKDMEKRKNMGFPLRHAHKFGIEQGAYFDELSDIAGLEKMHPVMHKLFVYHTQVKNLQARYKIINEENFIEL